MRVLVVGGAASGKSELAERLCVALAADAGQDDAVTYIATMESAGTEASRRIARHRALREGKGFSLAEIPRDIAAADLSGVRVALLEDLGNLVANELFGPGGFDGNHLDEARDRASAMVNRDLDALGARARHVVVVSPEVGAAGERLDEVTRSYCTVLSEAAAWWASRCDVVVEVVCGLPLWVVGGPESFEGLSL